MRTVKSHFCGVFFLTWLITKVLNQFICRHPAPEDLATPKHLLQSCPFCPSLPCRYLFFSSPTGKTVAPLNIGHRTSIWAENHPLREHPIQKPLCKHCSPPTARQWPDFLPPRRPESWHWDCTAVGLDMQKEDFKCSHVSAHYQLQVITYLLLFSFTRECLCGWPPEGE